MSELYVRRTLASLSTDFVPRNDDLQGQCGPLASFPTHGSLTDDLSSMHDTNDLQHDFQFFSSSNHLIGFHVRRTSVELCASLSTVMPTCKALLPL
jgi:hypothetical protein